VCLQVLHLVDFDQLKIENQQYLERIDAKNRELLQLKLSTGRTVQVRIGRQL
jgi:23S rRNA-/tRNA-specific pseudouridylate synthase